MRNDTIYRQAAIDGLYEMSSDIDHLCTLGDYVSFLESLSTQPEYTGHEESILTMLFRIAKLIIDLQGGYMEMTDGLSFGNNDLFGLAEKLGINY